jgi:bacillithiol biosynthesis cysteine-adding enzyme BshC
LKKTISYTDIPGSTKLFKDYVHSFERVKSFYSQDYRDISLWESHIQRIEKRKYERKRLSEVLYEQNRRYGSGEKTFDNIELLNNPDTLVVFTGQQIGLFTGPLYTLYKAITACKLSDVLKEKTGRKVIPLFWMESDDHNPREVDFITFLDTKNNIAQLKVEMEEGRRPVGSIHLNEKIVTTLDSLENMEIDSEFKTDIFKLLKSSYTMSENLADGFGKMMAALFNEYGLILVNSLDLDMEDISKPFFQNAVESWQEIKSRLSIQNEELKQHGYHNQIEGNPDILDVFVLHKGQRMPLKEVDGELIISNDDFSNHESRITNHDNLSYSPNVAMRPIFQDWLFPTLAYVGGSSEVAYFAQLKPLYELFGVEMPVIFPRAGFTLVEKSVVKVLEKCGVSVAEFLDKPENIVQKVISTIIDRGEGSASSSRADEIFDELERNLSKSFKGLGDELIQIDPSLKGALETSQKKILYQLGKLKHGLYEGEKKRNEILVRQIERTSNHLYPNGRLQERVFNIVHYLVRYGTNFLSRIEKEIDPFSFEHKVIEI